jgi:hypothetical protein
MGTVAGSRLAPRQVPFETGKTSLLVHHVRPTRCCLARPRIRLPLPSLYPATPSAIPNIVESVPNDPPILYLFLTDETNSGTFSARSAGSMVLEIKLAYPWEFRRALSTLLSAPNELKMEYESVQGQVICFVLIQTLIEGLKGLCRTKKTQILSSWIKPPFEAPQVQGQVTARTTCTV